MCRLENLKYSIHPSLETYIDIVQVLDAANIARRKLKLERQHYLKICIVLQIIDLDSRYLKLDLWKKSQRYQRSLQK